MMEKETQELLMAAKGVVVLVYEISKAVGQPLAPSAMRLNNAIFAFEAAQAKHPEHVMFIKADDGARTR
jgi:hypothetical protein